MDGSNLFVFTGQDRLAGTGSQAPDQLMQGVQAIHVKDCRGALSHLPQDIGGIHPDRARAAVGQLHHQEDNAVQPLEPPSGKQPAEQRMR